MDDKKVEEIRKQFEKIQQSENFTPDEDFEQELEDMINMAFGKDFEKELSDSFMTKIIKVKKLNDDAILPKYNYPSLS